MKKKVVKKTKVENGSYSALLKSGGKEYEATGETVLDCINGVTTEIKSMKGFSILKVSKEGRSHEMRFFPLQLRRLGINKNYKIILDKKFTQILH